MFHDNDMMRTLRVFLAHLSTVRGRSDVLWRYGDGDAAAGSIAMKTSASLSFELAVPSPPTVNTCTKC